VDRRVVDSRPDFAPEFGAAITRFGRVRKQSVNAVIARERGHRAAKLIAGEFICLGGDDEKVAPDAAQEIDQMAIGRLRGNVGVNQNQ